jgi:hypothetical protein
MGHLQLHPPPPSYARRDQPSIPFFSTLLDDRQPFLDFIITIPYRGVQRLIVGEECSGKFTWHGAEFMHKPEPKWGQEDDLPIDTWGPQIVTIRFQQFVVGREEEIKAHLEGHTEMDLKTKGMVLSIRVLTCEDEITFDRNLFAGGEITAKLPQ